MRYILVILVLAYSSLIADDKLFFKQPQDLSTIKTKVNLVWNNDYNMPLDVYYRIADEWILIDSDNTKNHYNNFFLPDADSIWFKIEVESFQPSEENFYDDYLGIDQSEVRGVAVVNDEPWFITKFNYLFNPISGDYITLPSETKSSYGMVSRNDELIFSQNDELWAWNVNTTQYTMLADMSNLIKNLTIVDDSLFISGFHFFGFYDFSNQNYTEIPISGQIYDIKKVNDKIFAAVDKKVIIMDEAFNITDSIEFPHTLGAIGVIDNILIAGTLTNTLYFLEDGNVFKTEDFGHGGIVDIEVNGNHAYIASRDGSIKQYSTEAELLCFLEKPKAIADMVISGDVLYYGTRDGYAGSYTPCQTVSSSDSIMCYIEEPKLFYSQENLMMNSFNPYAVKQASDDLIEVWSANGKLIYQGNSIEADLGEKGRYFIRSKNKKDTYLMIY